MSTAMNFGSKSFQPRPPDKGSFPLDHFGECKRFQEKFMKCLRENQFENALCRHESKDYLECRMQRQVGRPRPGPPLSWPPPSQRPVRPRPGPPLSGRHLPRGPCGPAPARPSPDATFPEALAAPRLSPWGTRRSQRPLRRRGRRVRTGASPSGHLARPRSSQHPLRCGVGAAPAVSDRSGKTEAVGAGRPRPRPTARTARTAQCCAVCDAAGDGRRRAA